MSFSYSMLLVNQGVPVTFLHIQKCMFKFIKFKTTYDKLHKNIIFHSNVYIIKLRNSMVIKSTQITLMNFHKRKCIHVQKVPI